MSRGTIRQDRERKTWFFVVDIQQPGSPRKQVKRRGFRTKRDAEDALQRLLLDNNARRQAGATRITLDEFLEQHWLPTKAPSVRPATLHGYRKMIENSIKPALGHQRLSTITRRDLEQLYAALATSGGHNGKPLSPKTVRNIHGVIHGALADAVNWEMIPANPAHGAKVPRVTPNEMTAWTEDEANRFLNHTQHSARFWIWRLLLATGMRRGELCGLRWTDINFVKGEINIRGTRVVADTVVDGPTKTAAGRRTNSLDRDTLTALRQHRDNWQAYLHQIEASFDPDAFVLLEPSGRPPHPETVSRWWHTDVQAARVPRIRLHDARHTAATLMLRNGVPLKMVSERLGHADVAITMRTYQHVTQHDDRAAAEVLGRILGGAA